MSDQPTDPSQQERYRGLDNISAPLWDDLKNLSPGQRSMAAGVLHRRPEGYIVPFLGVDHIVNPEERTIIAPGGAFQPGFQTGLVLLNYLTNASQDDGVAGRMVMARELNGGALFFQGPHALSKAPVLERFASDSKGFLSQGLSWGGSRIEGGDAAFRVLALPKILVAYTLYEKDEEFEARLTITFDAHTDRHMRLDGIWALINVMSARLAKYEG